MQISEAPRKTPVLDTVDVIVAGAGVSGCAAALASARGGARTLLIEREGCLGGVATAGLMANIGNKFLDRDGRAVIHGVAREILDALAARGGASEHWASREVPGCVVDSEQLKVVLAGKLREAGVTVLTHVVACDPVLEGDVIRGVTIESKAGRQAVLGCAVVDTTGEADLAFRCGCPLRWSDGTASLEFKMAGVDLQELYEHFSRNPQTFPVGMDMVKGFAEFERNWLERGIFFFPHGAGRRWNLVQDAIERGEWQTRWRSAHGMDAMGLYGLRGHDWVIVNSHFWHITSLDPVDTSVAELDAQQACFEVAGYARAHIPGFSRGYVVQLASTLGIRVSRGIEGESTLTEAEMTAGAPATRADVIGCQPAQASFEQTGEFFHSHTFDIPYGILVPRDVEGLLVGSGKSVSCTPQKLIRGMAGCMTVGQAAGAAAALCARRGVTPRALDVRELQLLLLRQGAYLGTPERLQELGIA